MGADTEPAPVAVVLEATAVGATLEGLQLAPADDETLLAHGVPMFDALYRSFEQSARLADPRAIATPRKSETSKTPRRSGTRRKP